MTNRRDEILEQLLELANPLESRHETGEEKWLDYSALGLVQSDTPDLLALMATESFHDALDYSKEVWVPLHCWRALAQLRVVEAIDPILDLRDLLPDDEWLSSDLPDIAVLIGPEALAPMTSYLARKDKDEYTLASVTESISKLGNEFPEIEKDCIRVLRDQMEQFEENTPAVNGFIVYGLLDLKALDCIDTIRRAYEAESVDLSICGDMEDVEIEFGLRSERSTPRRGYFDYPDNFGLPESKPYADPARYTPVGSPIHRGEKIGRNDPCPCGSGKKYKKCCLK